MAAGTYEVWLTTDTGHELTFLDKYSLLEYVKVANDVGKGTLDIPVILPQPLLRRDRLIQVYRTAPGGTRKLDYLGFLNRWQFRKTKSITATTLTFSDQNVLLDRRINAYPAGDAKSSVSTYADDAMKAVARENFGTLATDANRRWDTLVNIAADVSLGPTIEKAYSWSNVLKVLQALSKTSRQKVPEVFFGIYVTRVDSDNMPQLEFRTAINQPGKNLSYLNGGKEVLFASKWGNLEEAILEYDFSGEANYIYAGGTGEQNDRLTAEASDSDSIAISQFGRIEKFYNVSGNAKTQNAVQDAAYEALVDARPVMRFTGTLLDSKQARYGRDWDMGDRVTALEFDQQFDGVIRKVHVRVNPDGEAIEAGIEGEYILP